jgi:HD superfamily phosphodiesterase
LDKLKEIEEIARETFSLWDEKRQGFSWRNYYWNHTLRVRNLSEAIGRQESADLEKLRYAVTLHDITKRYDGTIVKDESGKRVVDENGFWITELVRPKRGNIVTQLYHHYDLYHTLHSVSGARIAGELLKSNGHSPDFVDSVKSIILAHLKPINATAEELDRIYATPESRILHDADMMDANLGYVAFYRNIQIHTHFAIQRTGKMDLKDYVMGLPRWIDMKESFTDQLMTETAKEMGVARQMRKRSLWDKLRLELEDFETNREYGILGIIDYFMSCVDDPNLEEQMDHLEKEWMPMRRRNVNNGDSRAAIERAIEFAKMLQDEIMGLH